MSTAIAAVAAAVLLSGAVVPAAGATGPTAGSGAPAASAATGSWTPQSAPVAPTVPDGSLTHVSCTSATWCMAVGSHGGGDHGPGQPVAEVWNGTRWRITPVPTIESAYGVVLNGVSCTGQSSCIAVGYVDVDRRATTSFGVSWDGAAWTRTPIVDRDGWNTELQAVSCVAPTACTAVGTTTRRRVQTVAEVWNGVAWELSTAPSRPVVPSLHAIACTTATACVAVGSVVETRAGRVWTVVADIPRPAAASYTVLTGVACPTATSCMAVGYYGTADSTIRPLAMTWSGGTWNLVKVPPGATHAATLADVSCSTATSCLAVGHTIAPQATAPLAEVWDGVAWTVSTGGNPHLADLRTLNGVSCPAGGTGCTVVSGTDRTAGMGVTRTFAEVREGTGWTVVATPQAASRFGLDLKAVSCVSADWCMAVGYYFIDTTTQRLLAARWDGATWTTLPLPVPRTVDASRLTAVSCSSATQCVAAATFTTYGVGHDRIVAYAEAWDGSTWTRTLLPGQHAVGDQIEIDAVSCVDAAFCVTSGSSYTATASNLLLIEMWDGARWRAASVPSPGPNGGVLSGVACASAARCMAVGMAFAHGESRLAVSWDGSTWTRTSMPAVAGSASYLQAVSCVATTDCMAVGGQASGSESHTLAQAWDGTTWRMTTTPDLAAVGNATGISCSTATACIVVGTTGYATDVIDWDGATWTADAFVPDRPATAVSCTADPFCMAVAYNSVTTRS